MEVAHSRSDEPRHACYGLQHNQSPLDRLHRWIVVGIVRDKVKGVVQAVHNLVHHVVAHGLRNVAVQVTPQVGDLLLGPDMVLQSACVITVLSVRVEDFVGHERVLGVGNAEVFVPVSGVFAAAD